MTPEEVIGRQISYLDNWPRHEPVIDADELRKVLKEIYEIAVLPPKEMQDRPYAVIRYVHQLAYDTVHGEAKIIGG